MSYGLHIDGKPPFSGVAMLVETLHVAGGNGEVRLPFGRRALRLTSLPLPIRTTISGIPHCAPAAAATRWICTRVLDYGGGLRWNTDSGYAYNATGSVDTVFVWRYKK